MPSESLGKRDARIVEHPAHDALLAFIREQCSEQEKTAINEHLLTGCASCNRLHDELKLSSQTLNHLNHMSRYLYYPELPSNQVWLHMQRGEPLTSAVTGKRKRKFQVQNQPAGRQTGRQADRTGLRVFRLSVPVAFGLFLLLTTVAIVLAYTLASFVRLPFPLPGQPTNQFYTPQPNQPSVAEHQPTPTPTLVVTMTPSPVAIVSPTPTLPPTIIEGAKLEVCSSAQSDGPVVLICGVGFKGVTKVWLEIVYHGSDTPRAIGSYPVNSAGEFRGVVFLPFSCKYSPVSVYAANKMRQPLTLPMTMNENPGCYRPTPDVTTGGHS